MLKRRHQQFIARFPVDAIEDERERIRCVARNRDLIRRCAIALGNLRTCLCRGLNVHRKRIARPLVKPVFIVRQHTFGHRALLRGHEIHDVWIKDELLSKLFKERLLLSEISACLCSQRARSRRGRTCFTKSSRLRLRHRGRQKRRC